MARKKKPEEPKEKSTDEKLLLRVRRRAPVMMEADRDNRQLALADQRFLNIPGEQWTEVQKKARGKNRPTYEFNKLRVTVKRVVNDMRANRPAGKVRAVEDGDKDTAETMEGLCRNIWSTSDGDTVLDSACEPQVGIGIGAWRVETKYLNEASFSQDIVISGIRNPFCLYADPAAADPLKRDAEDWFYTERISKTSYEARWPDAEVVAFSEGEEFDDEEDWFGSKDEMVRIGEYWWKEPETKTIYQTQDGRVVEAEDAKLIPNEIVDQREVKCHKIMMCIVSGNAVLEGPTEWAGSKFPFVMIFGEQLVIDGKTHWFGLTRFAKDAQRAYNVARTSSIEAVALSPQAKWWATSEQAKGHTTQWGEAHDKLYPFMTYTPDSKAPGPPVPMPGPQVPVALFEQSNIASDEIKAVTGIFDASLGQQGNETSGRAINARQQQGEIATFNYADNAAKGVQWTWEILVDLIPKVYDTRRSMRVLGVDGSEKYVTVNEIVIDPSTNQPKAINDLTRGQFDVAVTVGPSFATQRQQASEAFQAMAQADEGLMMAAPDLVYKAMDLPYSDEIAERRKLLLPPQIQQAISEDKPLPPEAQAAMAQVQQLMQEAQQHGQLLQKAGEELDQKKAEVDKAHSDLERKHSEIKIATAHHDAHVAKTEANLTLKQAQASAGDSESGSAESLKQLTQLWQQAITDLNQQFSERESQLVQTVTDILNRSQPQVIVANPPKTKRVVVSRQNGLLVGEIHEVEG